MSTIVELAGAKAQITLAQTAVDVMRIVDGKIAEFWRYYYSDLGQACDYLRAAS